MAYQAVHGRTSLASVGELLARVERREKPYHKVTVGDWLAERSEPSLTTFKAIAHLFGGSAAWYAFGEGAGPINHVAEASSPVPKPAAKRRRAK
jgi:hypothetical protein